MGKIFQPCYVPLLPSHFRHNPWLLTCSVMKTQVCTGHVALLDMVGYTCEVDGGICIPFSTVLYIEEKWVGKYGVGSCCF